MPGTENHGLKRDATDAHINPAALSPDHQSDNTGDDIPVKVQSPQPADGQHGSQARNQIPDPDDNQEEDLAATASRYSGSETGDHVDNAGSLADINNDNHTIDNNLVMDNLAAHAQHDQPNQLQREGYSTDYHQR